MAAVDSLGPASGKVAREMERKAGVDATSTSVADDLRGLARLAAGRSGADIERLVREARNTARRAGRTLQWGDLVAALGGARIGRPQTVRWRMAVHEAGHALVQLAVGSGTIKLISIEAEHGGMVQIEPATHLLETEAWIVNEIAVQLAGRAAEELVFGDPLAGSGGPPHSDLAVATEMAVKAETTLGFARHQPLLYRSMADRSHMLALDARLSGRVNARLEEGHAQAKAILETEHDTHRWLTETVLNRGVLEGAELDGVIAEARRRMRQTSNDIVESAAG